MSQTEWDFWTSKTDLRNTGMDDPVKELLVNCALKNVPPLKPRIELLEAERENVPRNPCYSSAGPYSGTHCVGHLVSSGEEVHLTPFRGTSPSNMPRYRDLHGRGKTPTRRPRPRYSDTTKRVLSRLNCHAITSAHKFSWHLLAAV